MGLPITVQVGPLASASATKICASQKAAGAQKLVLNGAAGNATANNICTSQTPGGAGALTLDGTLVSGGIAYLGGLSTPQYIYITCAGNESGRTFTVAGAIFTLNGPLAVTETITGANASTVSSSKQYATITSITVDAATAGAITVGTYSSATLDLARQVLFTSAGNDSGIAFAIAGTDWTGTPISETVTGANASTATTILNYLTVTSITTSGAVASTVTVGTNGVAYSPWVRFDLLASMAPIAIQVNASGTVNWTVQQTLDDPNVVTNQLPTPTYQTARASMKWVNHPDSNLVSSTTTTGVQGNYAYPPTFARVLLNSGTGTVTATFQQSGVTM